MARASTSQGRSETDKWPCLHCSLPAGRFVLEGSFSTVRSPAVPARRFALAGDNCRATLSPAERGPSLRDRLQTVAGHVPSARDGRPAAHRRSTGSMPSRDRSDHSWCRAVVLRRGVPRRPRPPRIHRQPPVHAPAGRGPGRRRVHRRPAPAPGPRHRGRGHGAHPLGGLVQGGRGRLPGPGRPLRAGGRVAGLSMGGTPDLLVGRAAPRDRRHRRGQPDDRPAGRGLPRHDPDPAGRAGPRCIDGIGSDIAKEGIGRGGLRGHRPLGRRPLAVRGGRRASRPAWPRSAARSCC